VLVTAQPGSSDPRFKLRQDVDAVTLQGGGRSIWSPRQSDYIPIGRRQLEFLEAFGEARTAREAAVVARLAWSEDLEDLATRLHDSLLLEPDGGPARVGEEDRWNARSKSYFQTNARIWTRTAYADPSAGRCFAEERMKLAAKWIERLSGGAPRRVLEVGCGSGRLAIELARAGHVVEALDSSPEMIEMAQEALHRHAAALRGRVRFRCADLESHVPVRTADFVVALGVLPFFDQPRVLFRCASSSLAAGGYFIVNGPNKLVGRRGPRWRSWTHEALLQRIDPIFGLKIGSPPDLVRSLSRMVDEVARATRSTGLDPPSSAAPGPERAATAVADTNPRESALHPRDLEELAREFGLTIEALAGTGFVRTAIEPALSAPVLAAVVRALEGLCELPASVLWMTGFLAVLASKPVARRPGPR
jgi:SAM-dependent methyltransferase